MSLIKIKINIDESKATREMRERLSRALNESINAISVLQLEQVSEAFRSGGQPISKWTRLWADQVPGHSRSGGQPLRDTGALEASFFVEKVTTSGLEAESVIASGVPYAAFHQTGFQTSGPNYIPLTRRGARLHATGANPNAEGLVRGVDFIMAWKGVTVPARPMIDYEDPINKKQIEETVLKSLQTAFGG